MKTEFADFVATQDARNTIQLKVREHCLTLCDLLVDNFKSDRSKHAQSIGAPYNPKDDGYKFYIESGRKYHKLIMETESGSRSVHAFVDKKSGEVYKPASFKAPAKIVRYNLLNIASREECFSRADWAGSYLYIR